MCSCKIFLIHGRRKIEESIDLENWRIGRNNLPLPKYKLHIATSLIPVLGDSITKLAVAKVDYYREVTLKEINFCAKLFSTFPKLNVISLSLDFWLSFIETSMLSPMFHDEQGTLYHVDGPDHWIEAKIDKRITSELFSRSCKSLSNIKLVHTGTNNPYFMTQNFLKPIGSSIFKSSETIERISMVDGKDFIICQFTREEFVNPNVNQQ